MDAIDPSLINWSRAQFALTAMYHWLFVPLTLGLGALVAIMETLYVCRNQEFWKTAARFWGKLFGINFALGVATGIILEFEFGTNWSNYSWFVGDIFGAPLAIEGIVAFFMESTFLAVMFFGWDKISRRAHLTATWMTVIGATLSAWWILVANAWMQNPVGMIFNPETVRNEMVDFAAVALSPTAVIKFCHTVTSAWILGSVFVLGVSSWYLLKKRHQQFSYLSIRLSATFGLLAALLTSITGHLSGEDVARSQPMKLAAMEGLYEGGHGAGLVTVGLLKPGTDWVKADDSAFLFRWELPQVLSLLATRTTDGYVPGIRNILEGGYPTEEGPALSAEEKIIRGRQAIAALAEFRQMMSEGDSTGLEDARQKLDAHFRYFGYGYLSSPAELVPSVPLTFYSFRIMVTLGGYFILLFSGVLILGKKLFRFRLVQWASMLSIPLAYLASEVGWVVAEAGRQPWAIQGLLPNSAAISYLETSSVQTTFYIFLILFTLLLISGICIMCKSINNGPES